MPPTTCYLTANTYTYTQDNTAPVISALSDNGATDKKSGDTVSITFNLVEEGSGQTTNPTVNITQSTDTLIGAASYTSRTGSGTAGSPYAYTYTYTVPAGNYANVKVKVDATDDVGNAATQSVLTSAFNIDNTAPTGAPTCSPGTSYFISSTGTISCTVGAGGTVIRYTTNGTAPTAASPVWSNQAFSATTTLKVISCDAANNCYLTANTYTYTQDNTAPVISSLSDNGATDKKSGDTVSITFNLVEEGSGQTTNPTVNITQSTDTSIGAASYTSRTGSGTAGSPYAYTYTYTVPAGNYTNVKVKVDATDDVGNAATQSVLTSAFNIDNTAPTGAPTCSPGTSYFISSTGTITCTVGTGGTVIRYTTGGAAPTAASAVWSNQAFSATTILKVISCDAANNCYLTANTYTYTQDNTAPVISALSDNGATDKKSGDTVSITFNLVEEGSGQTTNPTVNITQSTDTLIGAASYTSRTGSGTAGSPYAYTYTYTVPAGNYANVKVKVDATDDVGNAATQSVLTSAFNIDNTAPTGAPTCSPGTSYFISSTGTITCTVGTGGTVIRYTTGGAAPTAASAVWSNQAFSATTILKVISCDAANNCYLTANTYTYTQDNTAPVISALSDNGATDKKSGDTVSITFNLVEEGSGQTTNPTVNITQSTDTLIGAASYTSRTGSGTAGSPYAYTYTYTVPAGNYANVKVKVDATDDVGNAATQSVLTSAFNIDNTAPTAAPTCSPGTSYFSSTTGTITCTVGTGGTVIRYTTGGAAPTAASAVWSNQAFSATTTLRVISCDAANNCYLTDNSYTYTQDNTGPTGSIANGSGNPTNDDTPTLNLTIADAGVGITGAQMQFSCDNSTWSTLEAYATPKTNFDIKPAVAAYGCGTTDGSRTVYVRFQDSLGNTGSSYNTGAFTLDTVAPTVTINQAGGQADPANASPINFTVVFSESTTNFATGDVSLSGTAGATTGTVTGSGTTYNVAVSGMTGDGTVIATITSNKATDAAGNNNAASTSTDNTVTYDTVGPTGSIANGSGNPTNDDTPTLNLTIADAGVGITGAQMQFSCDNSTWSTLEAYATPKTNFDIKPAVAAYGCGTTDGSRTVYVRFQDSLGNTGSSYNTGAFTLDTVAPTVTINQAVGQADPANASPINFTVVFSESTTNFATGDVSLSGTAGATTGTVTGSGTTYNVAVSGMTGDGTVIATITSNKATDAAGNNNAASTSTDNTVTYDTTAPTGGSFTINSDANYTGSQTANTLNVTCPTDSWATVEMAYGNSAAPTNWTTCATTVSSYDLGAGQGTKTVYMRFRDGGSNTTSDTTDTITLDSVAPTVAITYSENPANAGAITVTATYSELVKTGETPTVSINQQGTTDITNATMTVGADRSIWTYSYTVMAATGGTYVDGTATVSLSTNHDEAGNTVGAPTGNTFTIDTTAPTGGSFTINSAATYTTSQTGNTLNVTCPTDSWATVQMAYGNSAAPTNWTTCAATVSSYDLGAGQGTKTVYMRFRDGGSNTTSDTTDTITLDSVAPTVAITYSENPANAGAITVTATYSELVKTGETPTVSINQQGTTDISNATMTVGANRGIWTYSYTVMAATGGTYVDGTATVSLSTNHDEAGNTVGAPTGNTFTIDTTAPTGGSFKINSDATYTTSQTGNTLNVTCPTDTWATVQMAYGNSAAPTNWTTCAATVSSYDLGAGQGTKTVYMRFRDGGSNTTSDTTDTITLDSVAPTITSITSVAGDTSAPYYDTTNDVSTSIIFASSDATTSVATCKWNTTDVAYASMTNTCASATNCVTDLSGEGAKTVYLRCIDAAGNAMASSQSVSYTVNATAPTVYRLQCHRRHQS